MNSLSQFVELYWKRLCPEYFDGGTYDCDALLAEWKVLETNYKGTGVYELRLANIHLFNHDFEAAKNVLNALDVPDYYRPEKELIEIQLKLSSIFDADLGKDTEKLALADLNVYCSEQAGRFPDYLPLSALAGHIHVLAEKYKEAIPYLWVATQEKNAYLYGPFRNLTIACSKIGEHEKALVAADKAFEYNTSASNDMYFILALAISYAATDNAEAAQKSKQRLITQFPEIEKDEAFVKFSSELNSICKKKINIKQ